MAAVVPDAYMENNGESRVALPGSQYLIQRGHGWDRAGTAGGEGGSPVGEGHKTGQLLSG